MYRYRIKLRLIKVCLSNNIKTLSVLFLFIVLLYLIVMIFPNFKIAKSFFLQPTTIRLARNFL